jgi:hypothetical protein
VLPQQSPNIRLATLADEEEIMSICRRLHDENGVFPMSDAKVRDMLRRAFNKQGGIIGVIGAPGHIEALICLILYQNWYSEQWYLNELFNYVLPEYRRSENAKELIIFAKACALDLRLPLMIGVLSNERTEAKVRLYQRQLGPASGAFFLVNGQTGHAMESHGQEGH